MEFENYFGSYLLESQGNPKCFAVERARIR